MRFNCLPCVFVPCAFFLVLSNTHTTLSLRLTELELDGNSGLSGCIPEGARAKEQAKHLTFHDTHHQQPCHTQPRARHVLYTHGTASPFILHHLPIGAPPLERLCGGLLSSLPCPGFTTDRMIGTATSGTRIRCVHACICDGKRTHGIDMLERT